MGSALDVSLHVEEVLNGSDLDGDGREVEGEELAVREVAGLVRAELSTGERFEGKALDQDPESSSGDLILAEDGLGEVRGRRVEAGEVGL